MYCEFTAAYDIPVLTQEQAKLIQILGPDNVKLVRKLSREIVKSASSGNNQVVVVEPKELSPLVVHYFEQLGYVIGKDESNFNTVSW